MLSVPFQLAMGRAAALALAGLLAPFYAAAIWSQGERRWAPLPKARIRIKAAPTAIHRLLDPAAAKSRWTIRGQRLEAIDARAGKYRLFDPTASDRTFLLQVTQSSPAAFIGHVVKMEDGYCLGAVDHSESRYDIAAKDDGATSVTLTEATTFAHGLPRLHLAFQALIMRFSLSLDLLRLKYEAETGRDADPQPD